MKAIWLGQAGWYLECHGKKIVIDPYLSNSVFKVNPANDRRMPIDATYLHTAFDYLLISHNHLDHLDPETLDVMLTPDRKATVLAPYDSWSILRKYQTKCNYVMLNEGGQWSDDGFCIIAVHAEHSDRNAVGFVLKTDGKSYYFSGDTLYHRDVISDVKAVCPDGVDFAFLPVNGAGNNMNALDAARLANEIGAKTLVPVHFGLFDAIYPKTVPFANLLIPEIYQEI
jgi:L-ascorbate metabolism protein UlaG (beta-lactamase superfamily)